VTNLITTHLRVICENIAAALRRGANSPDVLSMMRRGFKVTMAIWGSRHPSQCGHFSRSTSVRESSTIRDGTVVKQPPHAQPELPRIGLSKNGKTVAEVRCKSSGSLESVTIVSSSGEVNWDSAAVMAVRQADPTPLDGNG
jgi:TonB family protein